MVDQGGDRIGGQAQFGGGVGDPQAGEVRPQPQQFDLRTAQPGFGLPLAQPASHQALDPDEEGGELLAQRRVGRVRGDGTHISDFSSQ